MIVDAQVHLWKANTPDRPWLPNRVAQLPQAEQWVFAAPEDWRMALVDGHDWPVAIGGLLPCWDGRAEAWLLLGDACDRAALVEDVASKTRQALQAEREVQLQILLQPVLLNVRQHAIGQRFGVCRGERRHVERAQLAVHANSRRTVGG